MANDKRVIAVGIFAAVGASVVAWRYLSRRSIHRIHKLESDLRPDTPTTSGDSNEFAELEDTTAEVDERIPKGAVVTRNGLHVDATIADSSHPGSGRIYVRTFGCSHNVSDSEFMMGLLVKYGYTLVESLEQADLCIFNSCTVKNPSQDAAVNLVAKADSLGKKIVVTGCVPQAAEEGSIDLFQKASLLGVSNIDSVVKVVEETLAGNRVVLIGKSSDLPDITQMPKIRRNKLVEIIAISTGCLGQCTYCKTRHARGELGSYPIESIVTRVKTAVAEGVKQIWLTSEDLGAYGIDLGTNIIALLDAILDTITTSPDVMLRLGMTNPPYMLQHAQAVGKILLHPQVFEFLHVPVQSGANSVLRNMKREYTKEDFSLLVDTIRECVPNVTLATDIICGFPFETDEDHKETLELIERYKFPIINISQFYPRPGTPAARMTKVPTKIVKQRSSEVTALFESYTTNEYLDGQTVHVWFDLYDDNNRKYKQSVGHTKNYTKVIIPFEEGIEGNMRRVNITSIHKWDVRGTLVE